MLSPTALVQVLPTLIPRRFAGHAYRIVAAQYLVANPGLHPVRFLYGSGAPINGQRFTPRGGMPTLYFAHELATAFDEVNPIQAIVRQHAPGLTPPAPPGAFAAVRYQLAAVLDITDPAIQQALGTDDAELTGDWRMSQDQGQVVPTQQLGQAVFDCGLFQAIWYASARVPGAHCLAVFPDRLTAPDFLEVHDPSGRLQERLP